ncbi:uncharacterized protein K441DRAFT_674715 [Cenococcum geophilum 1.58]|uniref:uncharacterized protein n=1 Tax=Cenococcum geophilum 1.58 TaxID=794803 RepID=UPI00358F7953|nr:hypothetical protein K441DRAFT_674715 [Cenococcum geophilum 1.58]
MEQEPFEIDGCETPRGNASELPTHTNIAELLELDDGILVAGNPPHPMNKENGDKGGVDEPAQGKSEDTQAAPKGEFQNVIVRACGVVRHVNGNETPRTADLHREVEVGAAGPASAAVRIAACNKMEKLGIKRRKGMLCWSPNSNKQNSTEERRSCQSLTLEEI